MIVDIVNGFLGSGKTTLIKNLVGQLAPREKLAVLVNEFGEIGIDGILFQEPGLDVVELANGCICCTLNTDMKAQIGMIATRYKPDRLIIEPSGVATIHGVMKVLESLSLEKYIDSIKVILVVDASGFTELFEASRLFVLSQLKKAQVIFINKCDRVTPQKAEDIQKTISAINSKAFIITGSFGNLKISMMGDLVIPNTRAGDEGGEHHHPHHHADALNENIESFSVELPGIFRLNELKSVICKIKEGYYGDIVRFKGVFHCQGGWVRLDYVSKEIREEKFSGKLSSSIAVLIGSNLIRELFKKELLECAVQ